jgi:hypothetical protein
MKKPRKTVTLGDVMIRTDKDTGKPTKEVDGTPAEYFLKVWIPDDVDEAGIGQASIVLTKDRYINFRLLEDKEVQDMPEWKRKVAQLKAWIGIEQK